MDYDEVSFNDCFIHKSFSFSTTIVEMKKKKKKKKINCIQFRLDLFSLLLIPVQSCVRIVL